MEKTDKRQIFLTGILMPLIVSVLGTWASITLNQRVEQLHGLDISVLPSESAAKRDEAGGSPFDIFSAPTPTPAPDPNPRYTYAIIVRNDGDFPEENLTVLFGFREGKQTDDPLSGPDINTSSSLLGRTVVPTDSVATDREYGISIVRLNPDEWVSLQATWSEPLKVSVQARSDTVSESAYE